MKKQAIEFIDWMESALSDGTKMTDQQRSTIESVVAKSLFNLDNQENKLKMTEEELSCICAAACVFIAS